MSAPTVSFDGIIYTVSLFRPDIVGVTREEKYTFGEHSLTVGARPPKDLHMWDRAKINGPPAEDGLIYYLCAQPENGDRPSFLWLKGKEEADTLRKAIRDAEQLHWHETDNDHWRKDRKCSFCGSMLSECGDDHGDEMRDIQREALRDDTY